MQQHLVRLHQNDIKTIILNIYLAISADNQLK